GGAAWTFEDVAVDNATPCRDAFCGPGTAWGAGRVLCRNKRSACPMDCASSEACVEFEGMPACKAVFASGKLETYPDGLGLYISLAQRPSGELAIGFYDRIHGNLMVAVQAGGKWSSQIVDGESGGTDTGDKGIGA